ncbi:MAG: hypothetical protein P1S60_08625 [Anaerolineae bacterium]|nr:hypothetical protein [Anaerolineae bacterium]
MSYADQVRLYALEAYIKPAREQGRSTVTFSAKALHKALGYRNRYPLVCAAIDAGKFLDYARVTLVQRSGPERSSTVEWTFAI